MSFKEKLNTILSSGEFHQLAQFREPDVWSQMDPHERELLSLLFLKQGEHQLCQKNKLALSSFELSTQISPANPLILHMQAQTLLKFGTELKHFLAAKKKCKMLLSKKTGVLPKSQFFLIYHDLASILIKIGSIRQKTDDFYQADKIFKKLEHEAPPDQHFSILWDWALCWIFIGKLSGELSDMSCGIQKFQQAKNIGCNDIRFYCDHGLALIEYFKLVNNPALLIQATDSFKRTVEIDPGFPKGWLYLGIVFKKRYYFSEDLADFDEADTCFTTITKLCADDSFLWLQWGLLYLKKGKLLGCTDIITLSIEKFQKAKELHQLHATLECLLEHQDENTDGKVSQKTSRVKKKSEESNTNSQDDIKKLLYLSWGEAELLLGVECNDYNLITKANKKFKLVITNLCTDPYAWYMYAKSYVEIGSYFNSADYFTSAIEAFQKGLELDPININLLQGLASTFLAMGTLVQNPKMFVRAIIKYTTIVKNHQYITPDILGEWGVALFRLAEHTGDEKQFQIAVNKLLEAIQGCQVKSANKSRQPEWSYYCGRAFMCLGDLTEDPVHYEHAARIFIEALLTDGSLLNVRYHLAGTLLALGELRHCTEYLYAAIEHFEILVAEDPEDDASWDGFGLAIVNIVQILRSSTIEANDFTMIEEAEYKFMQAIALGNHRAIYHLACTQAMKKNFTSCIHYLKYAQEKQALPPIGDVMCDEWLINIHDEPVFREFLLQLIDRHSDLV